MIALDRQKNCPRAEDKTIVADVSTSSTNAAANATAVESAYESRKRHLADANGTRVPRRVVKKQGFANAQARVNTAVLNDARNNDEIDSKAERKLRAVLRIVEMCFDQLGGKDGIDVRVQKFIRIEVARILQNGLRHGQYCNHKTCQIALASRANALIAVCIVQACLERFVCCDDCKTTHSQISRVAPECSQQDLLQYLDGVKQLQLQNAGVTQRAQVGAAINIVMDWIPEQVCMTCADASTESTGLEMASNSVPPPLLLPPALLQPPFPQPSASSSSLASSTNGSATAADAPVSDSDVAYTMRDIILSAARLTSVRADVRCAALTAAQEPALAEWIRTATALPVDVLGVVLLSAVARKLGEDDATSTLIHQVCYQFKISPTSAEEAAETMLSMMKVEKCATLGAFGDGIF